MSLFQGMTITGPNASFGHYSSAQNGYIVTVILPTVSGNLFTAQMMYDPGCTYTTISHADCRKMGLDLRRQTYGLLSQTGSGIEKNALIKIPTLAIGVVQFNDVELSIPQRDRIAMSLLGQNILRRFRSTEQCGDTVIFRR